MARAQLHELLSNKSLAGIPLLLLGNKNDLEGHLPEKELVTRMDLERFKDRTVACFSISAKSQNRLDAALGWLSDLKPKK
jgi:ADP-ribosylation factor-like protein 8